ncbi:MAG: DNA gyrase subunit A, partial [Clostridia bacterium]|nr:DNA gyrase subunit A [Clostridia bacterium]
HILEGLARAIDIVDEIIATIRACRGGQAEAKQAIMDKFGFDDPQASAIVAYRLGQLAGLEILKIQNELEELHNKIADYEDILGHEERILQIIKEETRAIADKFGDDRRTEILNVSGEVDIEDLIPVEENILTLTHMGYIKRMLTSEYRTQRRGGRGISGMSQKDEDFTETIFNCSSHDYIAFFTNFGRTFRIKAYEVPESSRTSRGMAIVNLLQLQPDEKVTGMIRLETNEDGSVNEDGFLCMVTKNGIIKRSALADYRNVRKSGLIAINLDEGDELAWVRLTTGDDDLLVATREGMAIRFHETDARKLGRTSRGVRSIKFKKDGDQVVGFDVITDESEVLVVTETGYGRRNLGADYRIQNRGGSGLLNYRVEKYGKVAAIRVVDPADDVIMISANGVIIRTAIEEIKLVSRPAKGVKVMRILDDDRLITLSTTAKEEEGEELPEEEVETVDAEVVEE